MRKALNFFLIFIAILFIVYSIPPPPPPPPDFDDSNQVVNSTNNTSKTTNQSINQTSQNSTQIIAIQSDISSIKRELENLKSGLSILQSTQSEIMRKVSNLESKDLSSDIIALNVKIQELMDFKDSTNKKFEELMQPSPNYTNKILIGIVIGVIVAIVIIIILYFVFYQKKEVRTARSDSSLTSFIEYSVKRGYNDDQIKRALLSKGWQMEDINNAFTSFSQSPGHFPGNRQI